MNTQLILEQICRGLFSYNILSLFYDLDDHQFYFKTYATILAHITALYSPCRLS